MPTNIIYENRIFIRVYLVYSRKMSTTNTSLAEPFIRNIQKWVLLDKQLKYINEKTRQIRESKNELSTDICQYIQDRQWTTKPIEITDGIIKCVEKREYSPLSFSFIEECLDELIEDKEKVDYIIQYIKDHREVKTTFELRRITRTPE
jgi:hypothetical protein